MSGRQKVSRVTLRLHRQLTAKTLESAIYGVSPTTKASQGWKDEVKLNGLFVDLSKVEFAEFTSLAQLALLIEGAVRHGIFVCIALPLKKARTGEQQFMDSCHDSNKGDKLTLIKRVKKRIELRKKSFNFMQKTGFIEAIKVQHVPESSKLIEILSEYDSSLEESDKNKTGLKTELSQNKSHESWGEEANVELENNYTLSRIYPLRWFEPLDGNQLEVSGNFASFIISCKELGLTESDANAVAGTILKELVENTWKYSHEHDLPLENRPHALVGVIVLDPKKYKMRYTEIRPCMSDFVNWCNEVCSPIIRIVVGDSGNGVAKILAPYFKSEHKEQIPSFINDKPLQNTEEVLFWAFNKWSTSDLESSIQRRGTRGLWLVQRFVRAYGGAITIRAEDAMVGWIYKDSEEPIAVRDKGLRYIPGTLLEANLLPEDIKPRKSSHYAIHYEDAPPSFALSTVRCDFPTNKRFGISDVKAITSELAKTTPGKSRCVLAIIEESQGTARKTEDTLIDAVRSMQNLPNHGALAFLFTNVNQKQLETAAESVDLAREDIEDKRQLQHTGIPTLMEPVLLLGSRGGAVWFGEDAITRKLLTSLSECHDPNGCSIESLCHKEILPDFMERSVRDHPDIMQRTPNGAVRLRFKVGQLSRMLAESFAEQLIETIENGFPPCVEVGKFLTPSLEYVNRWIDVEQLLIKTIGIKPSVWALSRKLENNIDMREENIIKLFRVDKASEHITNGLSEYLGMESFRYSIPSGFEVCGYPDITLISPGTSVILCADLILTGDTVKRAISEILQIGAKPIAIVCILDARKKKTESVNNIPLISLTQINIIDPELQSDSHIIAIDPVLRAPLRKDITNPIINSKYEIEPNILLQWCQEKLPFNTLYCGHIRREVGKHFTTYVRAVNLISKGARHRDEIIDKIVNQTTTWIIKQEKRVCQDGEPLKSLEIWYPKATQGFAREIAETVIDKIRKGHPEINILKIRAIPRAACAGRWVFPKNLDYVSRPAHVIFIDWGAITRITVEQIMRLSGEAGATSFVAFVLLSQIPLEDELALRTIRSITSITKIIKHRKKGFQKHLFTDEEKFQEQEVPARILFLSSLRLGHYPISECPICLLRQKYVDEKSYCPTKLLQLHTERIIKLLEAHDREDIFKHEQRDLFNAPIDNHEIAEIIQLRQQLEDALRSTEKRNLLKTELLALVDEGDTHTRIAWIRLLSMELNWLKLDPLNFEELRTLVAKIAIDIIFEYEGGQFDIAEIQQAIIVLRASSKHKFAKNLSKLLKIVITNDNLVGQLFFDTYTLTKNLNDVSSDILVQLRSNLNECRAYLYKTKDSSGLYYEYISTVRSLIRVCDFLVVKFENLKQGPKELWRSLREEYLIPMKSHHFVFENTFDISFVTQLISDNSIPDNYIWERVLDAWDICQAFLVDHVFPYLHMLRGTLLLRFYEENMSPSDVERFQAVINKERPFQMGWLTAMICDFIHNPDLLNNLTKRQEFINEWKWWYGFFFKGGGGKDRPDLQQDNAKILKFLEACPVSISKAVKKAVEHMKLRRFLFKLDIPDKASLDIDVFCDKQLLFNAIVHVIDNAVGRKHRIESHETLTPNLLVSVTESKEAEFIILNIWNSDTEVTPVCGNGIKILNRRLNAFNALLSGKPIMDNNMTYLAQLKLWRW